MPLQMNMLMRLQEAANYSSPQSYDSDSNSNSHHDDILDSSLESTLWSSSDRNRLFPLLLSRLARTLIHRLMKRARSWAGISVLELQEQDTWSQSWTWVQATQATFVLFFFWRWWELHYSFVFFCLVAVSSHA